MTIEEFLNLPEVEGEKRELIHGEVVSMAYAGFVHARVKSNINKILVVWLDRHPLGQVFLETSYRMDGDTLAPDLSVLRNDRLTPVTKDLPLGAPDLAIDVVSSETAARLRTKIRLYLKGGSRAIWVVYPDERLVEIHSANGHVTILEQGQILEDSDALPGFGAPVAAIFEGL